MSLEFRAVIDQMTATPDRPVRTVTPPVRLSQNEMPWAPAEVVQKAMIEAIGRAHRYPDYHRAAVRAAIGDALDVPASWVAVDNGSGNLVQSLSQLVVEPGKNGLYGWPSFDPYIPAIRLAGGEARAIDLTGEGAMDLAAFRAAIDENTAIIYLCNPNNPTGGFLSASEIRAFLQSVPDSVLVVLDEAYREFVTAEPVGETLALVREFPNLVILRTLSKSFGLAGIRAGYAIAQEQIAQALRRVSVGFSLNIAAEAATMAGFSEEGLKAADERIAIIVSERERVLKALDAAGISHLPTQSNFIFIHGSVPELTARLEEQGVMSRPFPHGGGVRITVGVPEENDRVLAAFGL